MAVPRRKPDYRTGVPRRRGDIASVYGDVHGPELVARARAAAVTAGRVRREAVATVLHRSLAEGRSDMVLLHHRTLELIDAGYSGGAAPGAPLSTMGLRCQYEDRRR